VAAYRCRTYRMAACLEVHSAYASDAVGSVVGSYAPYVGDQCQASECVTKPRVATRRAPGSFLPSGHMAARDMQQGRWGACVAASMRTGRPVIRPLTDQGDEMPWFGRRAV